MIRMLTLKTIIFSILIMPGICNATELSQPENKLINYCSKSLDKLLEYQNEIKYINPLYNEHYPVVIVKNNIFYIFEYNTNTKKYEFIKKAKSPVEIPNNFPIKAAFGIEAINNRYACVVTKDIFNSLDGYITIFHEFVHCKQGQFEAKLKKQINMETKLTGMQELNYPFPYSDNNFITTYSEFINSLNNDKSIIESCNKLKKVLSGDDYKYMIWQEWKEGSARYIENKIKQYFRLPIQTEPKKPYSRVAFYYGGAKLIGYLNSKDKNITNNLETLLNKMINL